MLLSRRAIVAVSVVLASAGTARADYIDNFRIGSWDNGVGYERSGPYTVDPYVGQTFQAIGGLAQSLKVAVHPFDALEDSMRFHVLITTLQPNGANPGNILFESNTIAAPPGQLSAVTVNLHGLALTQGQSYGFILDFHTPGKGGQGGVVDSNVQPNTSDNYPQGSTIYPNSSYLYDSSWRPLALSRQDVFNNIPWSSTGPWEDLAFRMQFGSAALNIPDATVTPIWFDPPNAPEPTGLALGGLGALLACAARRWLRRSGNGDAARFE